jgi:beta-carotene hydroxylase
MLRHAADYRTLFWALVLFPLVPLLEYARPSTAPWLLPVNLYLAYSAGVLTHNHNHRAVFMHRRLNAAYSVWLSVFYGAPIFTWIPTHNQNHHRHTNGPLDDTRTWRYSNANTFFEAVTYPLVSTRFQLPAIVQYLRRTRRRHPDRLPWLMAQVAAIPLAHAVLFALAMRLRGWGWQGAETYFVAFGLPALFAPWALMFTNYVQHVHCDPLSEHNHSRNFVDPLVNWFLFDAGYHTVHHDAPGTHWSQLKSLHEHRLGQIDPRLNEHSIFSFCLKTYVFRPLRDGFRAAPRDKCERPRRLDRASDDHAAGSTLSSLRGLSSLERAPETGP